MGRTDVRVCKSDCVCNVEYECQHDDRDESVMLLHVDDHVSREAETHRRR